MKVKMTIEFSKAEREAISADAGLIGMATPHDCKEWVSKQIEIMLNYATEDMRSKKEMDDGHQKNTRSNA